MGIHPDINENLRSGLDESIAVIKRVQAHISMQLVEVWSGPFVGNRHEWVEVNLFRLFTGIERRTVVDISGGGQVGYSSRRMSDA